MFPLILCYDVIDAVRGIHDLQTLHLRQYWSRDVKAITIPSHCLAPAIRRSFVYMHIDSIYHCFAVHSAAYLAR